MWFMDVASVFESRIACQKKVFWATELTDTAIF
jgi:hypothetical protein